MRREDHAPIPIPAGEARYRALSEQLRRQLDRAEADIANLRLAATCEWCADSIGACLDGDSCGRCPECFQLPDACECSDRCKFCGLRGCSAPGCTRQLLAEALADAEDL